MPSAKKELEAARLGVFATPGLPLTHFNCGIRVDMNMRFGAAIFVEAGLKPAPTAVGEHSVTVVESKQ